MILGHSELERINLLNFASLSSLFQQFISFQLNNTIKAKCISGKTPYQSLKVADQVVDKAIHSSFILRPGPVCGSVSSLFWIPRIDFLFFQTLQQFSPQSVPLWVYKKNIRWEEAFFLYQQDAGVLLFGHEPPRSQPQPRHTRRGLETERVCRSECFHVTKLLVSSQHP